MGGWGVNCLLVNCRWLCFFAAHSVCIFCVKLRVFEIRVSPFVRGTWIVLSHSELIPDLLPLSPLQSDLPLIDVTLTHFPISQPFITPIQVHPGGASIDPCVAQAPAPLGVPY